MVEGKTWTSIVLEVLKLLGADARAVQLKEIYEAVKRFDPSKCDDSNIYTHTYKGRRRSEPRWKRDVRDALLKLKRKGFVVSEGRGLWRLATPSQTAQTSCTSS